MRHADAHSKPKGISACRYRNTEDRDDVASSSQHPASYYVADLPRTLAAFSDRACSTILRRSH